MTDWYSRPVFFVADGFTDKWSFREKEKLFIAQVDRAGCEIILSSQWPEKNGKGMLFISLDTPAYKALAGELAAKGVASKQGWWGYRTTIVADLDGNELYFPDPEDPGGGRA